MVAPMFALLSGISGTVFFGIAVGTLGTMTLSYVLVAWYLRKRIGVQPGHRGLLVMLTSAACVLAAFYVARRAGIDLLHGRLREFFWLALAAVWVALTARLIYERRSAGDVVLDIGPTAMSKIQITLAVVMAAMAVALVLSGESRGQALAYAMWSIWSIVMARGRLQIREGGIITGGLLPWRRIVRCAPKNQEHVHLTLNKGLQREIDVKLPVHLQEDFIRIVEQRTATAR
jgi:hypothetical protein